MRLSAPLSVPLLYSRGTSIKTRIETEQHQSYRCLLNNSRGTSIKTRIETFIQDIVDFLKDDSRGTSIKTRIETKHKYRIHDHELFIREAHPLKQGLKQKPR